MNRIFRIIKYLSPYKITLLILIIGLLIQQFCSLFLPALMSNIVDVGIRQGGIEESAPEAMSEKAYSLLTSFMLPNEKKIIENNYKLMDYETSQIENPKLINKYRALEEQKVYVLINPSKDTYHFLNDFFSKSSIGIFNYIKPIQQKSESLISNRKNELDINLENLYDYIPEIQRLSSDEIERFRNNSLSNLDPYQASAALNRQFYIEIKMDVYKSQNAYIIKTGAIMFLITSIIMIITIIHSYLSSKMSSGISMKLREDIFRKVESFSGAEFNEFSSASLITRTTNDVSCVKDAILMTTQLIVPPIMLAGGIIMALQKSVSMSWVIALGAVISSGIIILAFMMILPKNKLMQKLLDKFNLITIERLKGTTTIRSLGTNQFEEERFENVNRELTGISLFVNRVITFMAPTLTISMNLINVLIIWMAVGQIQQSKMQVGDMMAFMQYSMIVIGAFLMLVMMFASIPKALISINRIYEVLDKKPSIKDPENPVYFDKNFKGEIKFHNVSFKYSNAQEYVLKNVSFTARPGQTTAIIGSTGSGKSTLVKLIPRFYDVSSGEVLIDGIDVRSILQKDLRDKIGFTAQKDTLFSGTIDYNLRYGRRTAPEEEIIRCAESAQIIDFINENEEGLNAKISHGGSNVSGGQRQRLSIARALVKNPKILILDDSFSSLDFKTDLSLRKALSKHTSGSTVIIVTQRIGAIINSDKIIVMENGKIAGEGTHKQLLKNCFVYREIAQSQLSEEELI